MLAPVRRFAALIGASRDHGAVDRYLGLLATTLGRHDDAVAHHEAALAIHQRMRAAPWVRARSTTWRARSSRAAPSSIGSAHSGCLNDALDAANSIGMTKLVEEVLKVKLELQGVRSSDSIMASSTSSQRGSRSSVPDLRKHAAADGTSRCCSPTSRGTRRLNERLGDARTQELLRAHDKLVRDAVAAHGGTRGQERGRWYMIVFPAATAAVACAVDLQRVHDAHDFGLEVGKIRVRMGSHVGEVIREGDDFFGRTVILAARVAAQATGGEILVSDALVQVAGDPSDIGGKFGPPRSLELKGIRGARRRTRWNGDTGTLKRLRVSTLDPERTPA